MTEVTFNWNKGSMFVKKKKKRFVCCSSIWLDLLQILLGPCGQQKVLHINNNNNNKIASHSQINGTSQSIYKYSICILFCPLNLRFTCFIALITRMALTEIYSWSLHWQKWNLPTILWLSSVLRRMICIRAAELKPTSTLSTLLQTLNTEPLSTW